MRPSEKAFLVSGGPVGSQCLRDREVVVERYQKEKQLPLLDRTKFLVSQDSSMSQFVITLTRMSLTATQAFYLLVNKGLPSMSMTVGEVYRDHKDEDGFLYVTYASQEMFGCCFSVGSMC
uniref:Microtubule associated protein 1 light chain 3 gamma n=1 Tax=Terrapene triunguis TaxID=2587831 RepID=A0A674IBJ2_9SAUR